MQRAQGVTWTSGLHSSLIHNSTLSSTGKSSRAPSPREISHATPKRDGSWLPLQALWGQKRLRLRGLALKLLTPLLTFSSFESELAPGESYRVMVVIKSTLA